MIEDVHKSTKTYNNGREQAKGFLNAWTTETGGRECVFVCWYTLTEGRSKEMAPPEHS
jgi:hypothetical protein